MFTDVLTRPLRMSFSFLNIAMLAGLVSVGLPILAHLLSKRRYDVVQWGAMQFLQLGQKTRRRIRFQDILLLLLRMALLACLVFALARPYGQGAMFANIGKTVSRDIVFVIDGSGSMGWKGGPQTPHATAIQWVHEAIEELNPGDTVAILDARSQNRRLIHPPTTSMARVRKTLGEIPEPTGTSSLNDAVLDAVRILATTSNATREVIILTDGQSYPWQIEDGFALQRLDDLLSQPEVRPQISLVDLTSEKEERANWSVGQVELSREMTVPGFPIQFQTTIRQSAGIPTQKEVTLAINGQSVPDLSRVVNLLPQGEAVVSFEHVFPTNGHFELTVAIEGDNLPQDDQSQAIVVVEDGIPVLLVDGSPHIDETQSETFFLKSAFAASGAETPWVRATTIPVSALNKQSLTTCDVVFLCNIQNITIKQQLELIDFVVAGGGVIFAPGDNTDAAAWNRFLFSEDQPFLPATIGELSEETGDEQKLVTIDSLSLEQPWLLRFKKENGVDFWTARFSKWWELTLNRNPAIATDGAPVASEESIEEASRSLVIAKLTNGDPLLTGKQLGAGTVIQFAAPLDADWSTLPARNDFVPFVHELVFRLTRIDTQHNVEVGMPIRVPLQDVERVRDYSVSGPGVKQATPESVRDGRQVLAAFTKTSIPGEYWFEKRGAPMASRIPFIVCDDRSESDLTPLDQVGWQSLEGQGRMARIETMGELTRQVQTDHSRTELWWILLLFLLIMLICEVALTRRMVRQGHADLKEDFAEKPIAATT